MVENTEKDYFWAYIGVLVAAVIIVLFVVKSSEHQKFETTKQAIEEDKEFSAYRN